MAVCDSAQIAAKAAKYSLIATPGLAGGIGHEMVAPIARSAGKHGFGDKTVLKLLASAEFTAWPGVNQPDHAEIVIGAGRLAEVFPFLVALLRGPQIRRFLSDVTLLIVDTDRTARFAEEPAVGALSGYFPRFSRTRREGKHGDHDGDEFHGSVVQLANFSPAKRITAGQIMSQPVRDLNPLLIFMCAIRVKSGTGAIRQGASFGGMMDREISCILAGAGWAWFTTRSCTNLNDPAAAGFDGLLEPIGVPDRQGSRSV